ncbi:LPXTG cell wall anchor domain-containing protein [Jiangella ureilytica]|uniref:LPXTG cell wall anchor domain-containing protein n=1 Tax=Jiangella ureilytica TaxID=2530374 RepID=A0A4R4RYW1_9ACTN|nr:LPXTG cell wall anchor domain-containing protein [Jiangella ureilytica]TDC53913.1 LPXTG cell wall anchor domain-containing protein [Jiangella ureilytica]
MRKVTIAILAGLALLFGGAMPAWAEAPIETKASDCDAYPGSNAWCDPEFGDYDCDEIPDSEKPVSVPGADPFLLDDDNDGEGCEVLSGDDTGGDAGGAPPEEPPAADSGSCEAYADSAAWCSDGVDDYNCDDIDDAHKPVDLVDAQDDPFHLDDDVDGVGCEDSTEGDEDPSNNDDGGDDDAGTGGDGEALPNTGSGDLGPLWFAVLAFTAAGALLVTRRAAGQR